VAITAKLYLSGVRSLNTGAIDWDTDTINLGLYTASYTPNQDTHDFRDDLGANEASLGAGYTTGGATIGSRSATTDAASNEVRLLGGDVAWTGLTGPFRYGVIYKSRGGAASADELMGYIDFEAQNVSNANVTVDFDAVNGVAKYTVA
jgi:hypothetical protein